MEVQMTVDSSMAPARSRLTVPSGEPLLRLTLKLDAVVTGANGAAYLAAAGVLDSALGIPSSLLRAVGAFLLGFAAIVGFVATRGIIRPAAAGAIIAANAAWAAGSVVLAILDSFSPTVAGTTWIGLQALVVALFALLQFEGLAKAR
jgi:hypothetical protein